MVILCDHSTRQRQFHQPGKFDRLVARKVTARHQDVPPRWSKIRCEARGGGPVRASNIGMDESCARLLLLEVGRHTGAEITKAQKLGRRDAVRVGGDLSIEHKNGTTRKPDAQMVKRSAIAKPDFEYRARLPANKRRSLVDTRALRLHAQNEHIEATHGAGSFGRLVGRRSKTRGQIIGLGPDR